MKSTYEIGRIFNIPIKVHVTLIFFLPIITLYLSSVLDQNAISGAFSWGLFFAVGLFISVALHELGHAVVAMRKGTRVRQILLLPIGGLAQLERLPPHPKDEVYIALAGPAVSLALFAIGWVLGATVAFLGLQTFGFILQRLALCNLGLVLFNMLPSFPMDGGRVFRALMTPTLGKLQATRIAAATGRVMACIFGLIAIGQPNIALLMISIFIYHAAGAEYRMVQIQERFSKRPLGTWGSPFHQAPQPPQDNEVIVGPSPYRRTWKDGLTSKSFRPPYKLFDDLFEHWK